MNDSFTPDSLNASLNSSITPVPKDFKPKSFWERPEGVTGQIVAVSAIGALWW